MIRLNDVYPCVQGEGCLTGQAMTLVRLHGCPVGCPWCDTKETWDADPACRRATIPEAVGTNPLWCEAEPGDVARFARSLNPYTPWALVTGGEPALRPLAPLVTALHAVGFKAAVETSGTAVGHVDAGFDWVCASPKSGMPGGRAVLPAAVAAADEIKWVVGKPADLDALDRFLAEFPIKPGAAVCLQPLSGGPKATALCTETVKRRGLRLSLQVHKLIGER